MKSKPLSIYIHIPYCVRKCPYCDFNSYGVGMGDVEAGGGYAEALRREIRNYLHEEEFRDRPIESVFFGGGTPSLFSPEQIASVLSEIPLGPDTEVTLEANPGTVQEDVGLEKLAGYRMSGVNRVSFGAQSFSSRKLQLLGRLHSGTDIGAAVLNARTAGFARVSIDLIFGVADETLSEWENDLQQALALQTEHLSVYGLTIEPGTEFGRLKRRGVLMNLEDDAQAEYFLAAQEELERAGFQQYEVSNYARPGAECRHNLVYWMRGDYLGIGAGAHGFACSTLAPWGRRWRNIPGPEDYRQRVLEQGFGKIFDETLDEESAETEFLALRLRTSRGISESEYSQTFQRELAETYGERLEELEQHGCVTRSGGVVRATKKGFQLLNSVIERLLFVALLFVIPSIAAADEVLPEVVVTGSVPRVAIDESPSTISTLATPLRYEPYVDLQERGTPEGQGDLVIRGSTFENAAVSLGAFSITDPQTGHYVLELPLSPGFFSAPEILTGSEQSIRGLNASVGSVGYSFLPIRESEMSLRAGAGEWETNTESVFLRRAKVLGNDAPDVGVDLEHSRSRSGGSVRNGDSRFDRVSARLQLNTELGQTDLFGGFQQKFISWPYLYALQELHTLIGSSGIESDELRTGMVGLHHEVKFDENGSFLRGGFLYRENRDDYELDRFNVGLFNPFKHNTKVITGALEGALVCDYFRIRSSAKIAADWLNSTALTFGGYDQRVIAQGALVPELVLPVADSLEAVISAGVRYDETDRNPGKILPVTGVSLTRKSAPSSWERLYVDFSGASQVAGYTALASNPSAGLFRGNADLQQTVSVNSEVGVEIARTEFQAKVDFFYRKDENLVDWIYSSQIQPFAPRVATNVDIETAGFEALVRGKLDALELIGGYALLNKEENYGSTDVDASFYALNFPNHRFTAAAVYHLTDWIRLRSDNELRIQERNALRNTDDRSFLISSLSAQFDVPGVQGLMLEGVVDNLGNENFEEVPGVPGRRRFAGGFLNYRW